MRSEKLKKHKNSILLFILLLFTVCCSLSTDACALDVKRSTPENGLTLLVVERHNLPVVKVAVGINAGTLQEPADRAGLANLTAGLLTSGTKNRKAEQINEEIEFIGASLSGSGGDDYISVALSILKKDVYLGFDLLSDIIVNPVFPEDELNKKRERIKGSLRAQEEVPGFVARRAFKKAVFGAHPYGRLISGTPETLDRIKRIDLVNFHKIYYVPNNAVMSVVGDITAEEVKNLLAKYFSSWLPQKLELKPPQESVKNEKGEMITIEKNLTQANIILGHKGISRDNPDYYAVSVMNYILGSGGFASRLMQNLRDEKGLVYDIHSFFDASRHGGLFQVGLQTKNESANTAIEETLKEIRRISDVFVSDRELSDAKAFLIGSFPMRIETSSRIARFLVAVEYYGLGMDYIDKYPVYINSITKEGVLRVAKKYLDPEDIILVVVADLEKASLKKEW